MLDFRKYINVFDDFFVVRNFIGLIFEGVGVVYFVFVLLVWVYFEEIKYVLYFVLFGMVLILFGVWFSRYFSKIEDVNFR